MAALIPSASATGSGTMTLAGPSTNSNQTITIPDATGTMMVSGNMPAFSAYTNSTVQSIADSTLVKVLFQVEEFDTNNNFASSRFTPTVAGYYQLNAYTGFGSAVTSGLSFPTIYKNGSRFKDGCATPFDSIGNYATVSSIVYANGTTDYFEIYVFQSTGSSRNLNVNDQARVWFNGSMVRGA